MTSHNRLRHLFKGTFALIALLFATRGVETVAQPDASYAPRLEGTIFNVKDFGALGDDTANDTAAIRAALDACEAAGGGTVYLPAGTYRVCPTEEDTYTFVITFGNLTIEGDGYEQTKINFLAWGMQDPEGPILHRGGGFKIRPLDYWYSIDGVTLRGFRATGNARPTAHAGEWWGEDSRVGWDISHKGVGIWGDVDNVIVEDCEFDHWRGEVIYAGGGLELGKFSVKRSLINNSNASAISMGGDILVEDTEIYAVHNGTECLSMGGHQKLVIRNCVIEPNRDLPEGVRIGKFGIVYLGYRESSLVVENSHIGDTTSGGVFLSEFAHNVRIENNTFQDTVALYGIFLNMYKDYLPESIHERGWTNFDFINNTIEARERSIGEAIVFHTGYPGEDWRIIGNELRTYNGNFYNFFIRTNGVTGEYIVKDNYIEGANPVRANNGPRPLWINNTVTGYYADGTKYANYDDKDKDTVMTFEPSWPRVFLGDLRDGVVSREAIINPALLDQFPVGFEVEIRRTGSGAFDEGIEIKPDPTWNTLTRGYMIYADAVLKLAMGENGLFELVSFVQEIDNTRTITHDRPRYHRDYGDISVYGQSRVILKPSIEHTYNNFSGIALGQTVEIDYNALTRIAHVPGVLELSSGRDFVANQSGTLIATRVGEVLKVVNPNNKAPFANSALVAANHSTPISFNLPASDPDGDALTVRLAAEPTTGTLDFSGLPVVVFAPYFGAIGSEDIVYTVSDGVTEASASLELRIAAPDPTLDTDKDGFSDHIELVFGTDGESAKSQPRISVKHNESEGTFELHLPSVAHGAMQAQIESSSNMTDWKVETTIDQNSLLPVAGQDLCYSVACDPDGSSQAIFFRLVAPPVAP